MATPLPPGVRRMIAATAVSSLGTGLTLPFTLILLHEVRHIPLPTVGLLLAVPGVLGLAAVPVGGVLVDRFGPLGVLRVLLVGMALANGLLGFVETPLQALPVLALLGASMAPMFPAASALMHGLVDEPSQMQRAFGLQFTALNAAIGVGSLIGGTVVDTSLAWTFIGLYLGNAVLTLTQALILPRPAHPVLTKEERQVQGSYREVLADPTFRRVCIVSLLLAMTGYAALDSGLPAYALIVTAQVLVMRLIRGWRRSRALAVTAGMWAASWLLLGTIPGLGSGARVAIVIAFGAVFGLGETFMAPTLMPLVQALATEQLRGRYNALSQSGFSVAFVLSPALSGLLIGRGHAQVWLGGIVTLAAVATLVSFRLARELTDEQDGLVVSGLETEREGRLEVVP
jgi:MFS family permease